MEIQTSVRNPAGHFFQKWFGLSETSLVKLTAAQVIMMILVLGQSKHGTSDGEIESKIPWLVVLVLAHQTFSIYLFICGLVGIFKRFSKTLLMCTIVNCAWTPALLIVAVALLSMIYFGIFAKI